MADEEEQQKPFLYVEFEDEGSVLFTTKPFHIHPNQLAVLIPFLQHQVDKYWDIVQQQSEVNRIQVPQPPDIQVARR